MSDIFGDDFTAELRSYYLKSVVTETEKFLDLIDETLWKRLCQELLEQGKAWAVDAKMNDFVHLASWFEGLEPRIQGIHDASTLTKLLQVLKSYAEALLENPVDSMDLYNKFSMIALNNREVLFLYCVYGQQEFAIPLDHVLEISSGLQIFPLPDKRKGIEGVVSFRGEAIPAVKLQDYGFMKLETTPSCSVICEHEGTRFSINVTTTKDLISVKENDLQDAQTQQLLISTPLVKKFFIQNERSIMILDINNVVAA